MVHGNKLVALGLAGLLSLSLMGCSGGSSKSSSDEKPQEQTQQETTGEEAQEESAPQEEQAEEAAVESDIAVSIDDAVPGVDYDGNPVVIVTYTFTNVSSEEAENFLTSCIAEVYQNGVQCDLAFVTDLEGDSSTKVKAGASTTFQLGYSIADQSPIEIEVKKAFSWDDVVLATATFKFA